ELHQVAGAEPGITVSENISQDLLLGLGLVGIALEAPTAFIRDADAANRLADLAARAGDTETIGIAQGQPAIGIDLDDARGKTVPEQWWDATDRARLALDVEQREIAFGRGVEFEDAGKRKACLEIFPDIAAQAVAAGEPQAVTILVFRRRRLQEIAA